MLDWRNIQDLAFFLFVIMMTVPDGLMELTMLSVGLRWYDFTS